MHIRKTSKNLQSYKIQTEDRFRQLEDRFDKLQAHFKGMEEALGNISQLPTAAAQHKANELQN